jgi:hypothetical protein
VTAAGGGLLEGAPDENVIENTTPGGPIGPVFIQPNTNPSGSGAGSAVTKPTLKPQQQFSPEYQAWRNNPNNAKTVAMIDSLSPDGQKIANTKFAYTAVFDDCPECLLTELERNLSSPNDKNILIQFINAAFASVTK